MSAKQESQWSPSTCNILSSPATLQEPKNLLPCNKINSRTTHLDTTVPTASVWVNKPNAKPQRVFWRIGGRSLMDQGNERETRQAQLQSFNDKMGGYQAEVEHLNELDIRHGTIELQSMLLLKLAAQENKVKALHSEKRTDYVNRQKAPRCITGQQFNSRDYEEEAELGKLSTEVVDAIAKLW